MQNNYYVGNKGYIALKKQTDKDTAVIPDTFVPYQSETLSTSMNKHLQETVKGNRFQVQDVLPGQRSHMGDVTMLAEPNTAALVMDMLMTRSATAGSDPYTHTFVVGDTENHYTVDIQKGRYVERFVGVKANTLTPNKQDNGLYFDVNMTGLKSFKLGKLAGTPTFTDPTWNAVLDTDYDPSATDGLVVGDTLIFDDGAGTTVEAEITAVTDGTNIEVDADITGFGAGDTMRLAAQSPSFALLTPFLWSRTEFHFGATASAALSAAQTRLDEGSSFSLTHSNDDDEGSKSSGSFDPDCLRRTVFNAEFTSEVVFSDLESRRKYLENEKQAVVIRMFSGAAGDYEMRVTLNDIRSVDQPVESAAGGVVKLVDTFQPSYDASDAQAIDVKVINAIATI